MGVREPKEGEFPPVPQRSRLDLVSMIPASSLGLDEYQRLSEYTMNTGNQSERDQFLNVAVGLWEAGEFAGAVKKHVFHEHPLDKEEAAKELGDLLFYVQWGCLLCGTTLGEVAKENLVKLATRYPDGFSKQASLERKDMLKEAKAYDAQK